MGGCQNYGPLLGSLITRCRTILRHQKRDHNFDNHPCGLAKSTDVKRVPAAPYMAISVNWGVLGKRVKGLL